MARGRDATLLREILDHTSERVEKELADQPEVQGDLWFMLGSVYEDISDDSRGIDMFQSAADSYRIALGEENIKRARALARVGSMKSMTGDAVTGKKTAQLAVDIARGCGDPVVLAECLYHRAVASRIYGWSGRTGPEDLPLLRESVDLFRQTDTDPVGLIQALNRLGYSTPDRVEAESLLREALALGRQYLPPDHPEIGNLLGNLGAILIERGQLGEAEETLRQSVELHRKLHANGNPHHKAPRLRLITALALGGKWDEAEALSRESLETSTANGESHRYFCLVLVRLLASRGKLDAALVESARSLEKFPRDKYLGIQRCSVLLQAGQEEECRHLCHQLLQNAKSPLANVFVAKLACLLPVEGDDFERACQWANASVSSADLKLDVGVDIDCRLAQAMAEYRRGHYDSVNGWVSGAIEERLGGPSIVQAKFLQAMVHARLRQAELARKALVEGDELLRKPHVDLLTPYGSACLGGWYLAELLRKEAANLIDSGNQASARE